MKIIETRPNPPEIRNLPDWSDPGQSNPLLSEVNLFRRASENNHEGWLAYAREYSYWNNRTALLEAVSKRGVSLTRQDYQAEEGAFYGFGQPITSILSAGLRAVTERSQSNPGYQVEVGRRELELREEQLLEELARSGGLNNQLMLTISPYPEELSESIAAELGYVPKTRSGKVRIHNFNPGGLSKETAEIFFTESSLPKIRAIAKALGKEALFRSLSAPSEALGQPVLLDKSLFPDYLAVLNSLSSVLYDDPGAGEQIVKNSYAVLEKAEPLIGDLVGLDEDLAVSLIRGEANSQIREIITGYLEKIHSGLVNLSDVDYGALRDGLGYFSETTAAVLKKIALVNTYIQVSDLIKRPKENPRLSLFNNQEAIEMAMAMGAAEMSYCGVSLNNPYGAYGWGVATAYNVIFGQDDRVAHEPRTTRCPSCQHEWLVTEAVHGKQGIRCSCGNSVRGEGALCIVRSSKLAGSLDRLLLNQANTDTLETYD